MKVKDYIKALENLPRDWLNDPAEGVQVAQLHDSYVITAPCRPPLMWNGESWVEIEYKEGEFYDQCA